MRNKIGTSVLRRNKITVQKYPKPLRFPIGKKVGKRYLTPEEANEILSDVVTIEEKLDGKTQSKRMDGHIVFGEFMKWKHSIKYDKLPNWFVVFDIYDTKRNRFLNREEKEAVAKTLSVPLVPLIFKGKINKIDDLAKFLGTKSAYSSSDLAEGIVVKNYKKQKWGKVVRTEFTEGITTHWIRKPKEMNRLRIR